MPQITDWPLCPWIRAADFAVRPPWSVGPRRLLDYLLMVVEEGECIVTVSGVAYRCEAGDVCLVQPGELHTLRGLTKTITPYAHLDFFYNPERQQSYPTRPGEIDLTAVQHLCQPRLNDCVGVQIPVRFRPADASLFTAKLLRMIGLWQNGDRYSQLETQQLATDLFVALIRDFGGMKAPQIGQPQSLEWVTAYLSLRLAEPITVAELAARAHLSVSRFAHLFRTRFGCSPHRYLLRLRILHAQDLLMTTHLSIAEIAESSGFSDARHLTKIFRKSVGTSPSGYRAHIHAL